MREFDRFDSMRGRQIDRTAKAIGVTAIFLAVSYATAYLVVLCTVIYVAYHFISKVW